MSLNLMLTELTATKSYNESKDEPGGEVLRRIAHILLVTASPLQRFIDKPPITHAFCNTQALEILTREAFLPCGDFFSTYIKEINSGGYWADSNWKNIDHYLELKTGKGIWPFGQCIGHLSTILQSRLERGATRKPPQSGFLFGSGGPSGSRTCAFLIMPEGVCSTDIKIMSAGP